MTIAKSYLNPKNYKHSRDLLLSSMPFIDWTNPETVMQRAEIYLKDGEPIKSILSGAKRDLLDMKILRNHIAHNSAESNRQYEKMLRRIYGVAPLNTMTPGKHLIQIKTGSVHYLNYNINRLLDIGRAIAN